MNGIISKEDFEALEPDCQNVWLAKDILYRLDTKQFEAYQGNTLFSNETERWPETGEKLGQCYGCAVGAALYSRCMIQGKGIVLEGVNGWRRYKAFGAWGDAIEAYFEGWNKWENEEHRKKSSESRLRFICQNLIENGGKFLPGKPGESGR